MQLPIKLYGASILRKKCSEPSREATTVQFIEDMQETLSHAKGIGLAAPQVGQLIRVFTIDTYPLNDEDIKIRKGYLNPEILDFSDEKSYYTEGCLSIPGIWEDTLRPEKIWVKYLDEKFTEKREELGGIVARIFQHEYDHLEGILFIDHLSFLRKKLIQSKLNQIRKVATNQK